MVNTLGTEVLSLIRTRYSTLSATQKKIADYVLENPEKVIMHSISELANICGTSETTVMRFIRKLDFNSYQVFRVGIAQEISAKTGHAVYGDVTKDDTIEEVQKKVIKDTDSAIIDLDKVLNPHDVEKVIDGILNSQGIIIIGVGASGFVAGDIHHKIIRLGIRAEKYSDSHMMSIRCTQAKEGEIIIAVSHSGESKEIIDAVEIGKSKGAKVFSITSHQNSTLSKLSDVTLYSSSKETSYRSDAMISRILQLVIVDIICVGLLLKMGEEGIENINQSRLSVAKKKN
ncbi:MAG: MurR/RpiR family transcriptional regulator [Tissierellia bacterium]|nr:MurR/RpiR family transcriptional regulator [Tissierellia bacterium]